MTNSVTCGNENTHFYIRFGIVYAIFYWSIAIDTQLRYTIAYNISQTHWTETQSETSVQKVNVNVALLSAELARRLSWIRDRWRWRHHVCHSRLDWDWQEIQFARSDIIQLLIHRLGARAYLEIGCDTNVIFSRINVPFKVGVDPVRGGTHRMTSDTYFANHSDAFDVIFIDGLHTYEQARRDLRNAVRALKPGGWIVLHDLLPRHWQEEHVPRLAESWTGDVWKVAFELIAAEGIDFRIIRADHGIGLVRLCSVEPLIHDLWEEMAPLRFQTFFNRLHELPVVECDEALRLDELVHHGTLFNMSRVGVLTQTVR